MSPDNSSNRKAQLDKAEREALEGVVVSLRETVEEEIEYELEHHYGLTEREGGDELSASEQATREELVEAISLEGDDDHSWEWRYQQYISGMGYTIVNRLAAFRCMEVRGFLDRPVTQMGESGMTPAAEQILTQRFELDRDEAIIAAYYDACEEMAAELEILFDPESKYSVIDPDADLYRELIDLLDQVGEDIWRADDVLGWIYEYYNRPIVDALDAKNSLEPEDVGPANQFYTPHWVVRMLTDNSLGKLYLESRGQESTIPDADALTPKERKERPVTPEDSPTIPELCTYLVPDEKEQEAPSFDHPRELSIIDPACGSGHFLLYAFDVLERIWWAETELERTEIPAKVLEHNLFGVDIDLRSCQLSAFNLYLKARTRTEEEDGQFEMPNIDIVCADANVAEVEEGTDVLDEITGESTDLREVLDEIIDTFQHTEALGSLLDVSGTLKDVFESGQTGLSDWDDGTHQSLNSFLKALREAVNERTSDSFGEQNLKSFLNLLVVLTQEYDVSLMNPPYGTRGRMPDPVQEYTENKYKYTSEYYINFFEACERLVRAGGRVGMLIKREFMFKGNVREFREDFIGERGSFDFVAEFGIGLLDKATVRNAGAVVRIGSDQRERRKGDFIRLHDVDNREREATFLNSAFSDQSEQDQIKRWFSKELSEFELIPGSPLSYWVPTELRSIYDADMVLDAGNAGVSKNSLGVARAGIQTGNNARFVSFFWEVDVDDNPPYAKGGRDAWILPQIKWTLLWEENGKELRRSPRGNGTPSEQHYFKPGLTYTAKKESGRRFGYLPEGSIFAHIGSVILPDYGKWQLLSFTNSALSDYLMIAQTPDRSWEVGNVAKIPCYPELLSSDQLKNEAQEIASVILAERRHEFRSPHYTEPLLLRLLNHHDTLWTHKNHPHRRLLQELDVPEPANNLSPSASIREVGIEAARYYEKLSERKSTLARSIDSVVFDQFGFDENQQETVLQEIALRTTEDPRQQENFNPESITEPNNDFPNQIKDLLLHLALRAIHDTDDGIIPHTVIDGKNNLLDHIEAQFERIWGEHATDRLSEVDQVLGDRSAEQEAYPNLRAWLENDLFEYHVSKFDRTPILWKLSSKQLTSNDDLEGFSCLIDYHQLDAGFLDSLTARYLEPRKEDLRNRRNAADRRRDDESLGVEEQSEAADEYHRYHNGLEQLDAFEQRLEILAGGTEVKRSEEMQKTAQDTVELVEEFREQTVDRLDHLDELAALNDVDMQDLFTDTFYETIEKKRDEWIDALEDLETALEAYSDPEGGSIEAHFYDLLTYFGDVVGSDYHSSNGILFMTWYFDDFEPVDQQRLGELSDRERILGELAQNLTEYKQLAEDISEACSTVRSEIDDDWKDRALEEITAEGYRPNHKHGVAINITPFAEQNLVPEIVEDKVL